jgi:hypothetical protein
VHKFLVKLSNIKFHENPLSSSVVVAREVMDGQTGMAKLKFRCERAKNV